MTEGRTQDRQAMSREVLEGLLSSPKVLSPKYFYDTEGSELFEEITRLDAYYPTRTERALLERWMPAWVHELCPRALVELGAGSAVKSRVLLDAMSAAGTAVLYVPVDVSGDFLHQTARRLRAEYGDLRVEPAVADITEPMELPGDLPAPAWYALLGSTIGNFEEGEAIRLLRRVAERMRPDDAFLLGVDRRPGPHKSRARLEEAYDDARGVTAAFNLNVLRVLNRDLGADFDLDAFRHRAFYDDDHGRIEMHLVSEREQDVTFGEGTRIHFEKGESVRTELSHKYDRPTVESLMAQAGMHVDRWTEDDQGLFALVLARTVA